jgi:hypothetical protein
VVICIIIMIITLSIKSMLSSRRTLIEATRERRLANGLTTDPSRVPCPLGYWSTPNGDEPYGARAALAANKRRWRPWEALPVLCQPCPDGMSTRTTGSKSADDCFVDGH